MLGVWVALWRDHRQNDDELGAAFFGEFGEEFAAMGLDDLAADEKAQSETRPVVGGVGSVKWLEKLLALLDRDT